MRQRIGIRRVLLYLAILSGLAFGATARAGSDHWSARSVDRQTSLLELYTSEGCNSCPPADRWLSEMAASGLPPSQVVPLAFHVDYWDHLGWRDRFADRAWSERQRDRARLANSRVFTPQFLVNGEVVFNTRDIRDRVRQTLIKPSRVELSLVVHHEDGRLVVQPQLRALSAGALDQQQLFVAVYENDLFSEVDAGENAGRQLRHNYVVRRLFGPAPADAASPAALRVDLDSDWNRGRLGIAAFVQDRENGRIQQAVDLPLVGLQR